ncbi:hypothetical protein GCM10010967_18580 [Dyadobacter beijingensis]|uniref:Immunity protein 63 n=1 Tax=Dyadobacter beijingensis TaxID=365489 RepID=A0ABQ2HMV4_9BACT|nr:hypothetical protein [Dyadobacter beijingensis]GGM86552.1 hypothetical protein GCM10010967_18580 [Dyadobacter beijingensis]
MKQVQKSKNKPAGFRAFLDQIFTDRTHKEEYSENRYSVLYTLNDQYQHIGCPTQEEAQLIQGLMLTDENRVPVGIYDSRTDSFEWEIVGEYLTARGQEEHQRNRQEAIVTIARALRRRDASWHPEYLQRPSFFA